MTSEVVWISSTHEFTPVTRVHPINPLAKSAYMCRMALAVLWNNSTYELTIETLLLPGKSLWNSVDMRSMTLEVV